jgi:hypothetical protein
LSVQFCIWKIGHFKIGLCWLCPAGAAYVEIIVRITEPLVGYPCLFKEFKLLCGLVWVMVSWKCILYFKMSDTSVSIFIQVLYSSQNHQRQRLTLKNSCGIISGLLPTDVGVWDAERARQRLICVLILNRYKLAFTLPVKSLWNRKIFNVFF